MKVGEAVVTGASQRPEGAQEVEFDVGLPGGKLRTVECGQGRVAGHGRAGPTPPWRMAPIQSDGAGERLPAAGRYGRGGVFLSR